MGIFGTGQLVLGRRLCRHWCFLAEHLGVKKPNAVDCVETPFSRVSRVWGEPQQEISTSLDFPKTIFFWKAQPIEVGEEHVSSRKLQNISIKASPTRPFCRLIILQTTPSLGWQSEI